MTTTNRYIRSISFLLILLTALLSSTGITVAASNKIENYAKESAIKKSYEKMLSAVVKRDYDYIRKNTEEYSRKMGECNGKNSLDRSQCTQAIELKYSNESLAKREIFKLFPSGSVFNIKRVSDQNVVIEVEYKDIRTAPRARGYALKNVVYYMPAPLQFSKDKVNSKVDNVDNISYYSYGQGKYYTKFSEISDDDFRLFFKNQNLWPEAVNASDIKANQKNKGISIQWNSNKLASFAVLVDDKKYAEFKQVVGLYKNNSGKESEYNGDINLSYEIKELDGKYSYTLSIENTGGGKNILPTGAKLLKVFMYDESTPPQEKWITVTL